MPYISLKLLLTRLVGIFFPPTALATSTPGDDDSWPIDHRAVLRLVLDEVEDRIAALWDE